MSGENIVLPEAVKACVAMVADPSEKWIWRKNSMFLSDASVS